MTMLEGVLERITFHSEEDGYTVARVMPRGKQHTVTVVGKLLGVQVGESLELEGQWVDNADYGRQFAVERYRTVLPATVEGIRRYLGSGLVKGVGPVTARRITETFGAYTLNVIDNEPDRLVEVKGLGAKRVALIKRAWHEQQQIKQVMLFLQELQISPALAVRIYKQYGDGSLDVVRTAPYQLADDVYGIGFLTADKIAQTLGIPHDSPQRIGAGLRYTLSQATDEGHCYLPWDELSARATKLLEVEAAHVEATLDAIAITNEVHVERVAGARQVYLKPFFFAERAVAERLKELLHSGQAQVGAYFSKVNWPPVFAHLAAKRGINLTERQREAVVMALTRKVSVLTGGPGTGKCVRGDTLVATEHGLIPIVDLMPAPMEPDTALPIDINVQTRDGLKRAAAFYYGGRRATLRVTTAEGYSIEGTPNHRIIVATKHGPAWRRLDEVHIGAVVVICDARQSGVRSARVMAIEPSEAEVYDLHVPDGNEFIANGFVNHNTTTLRTVILALEQRGYRYVLASPTGRAAKRLSEAAGAPATTIHRLLEFSPMGGAHFQRNAENPLDADVVVIDEVSMLDVLLANSLIKAVPRHAHLLLVGDADQLPSVGPGRVLRDVLESGAVPSVHLDAIFRQAGNSGIITNAHRINAGEFPQMRGLSDFFFFKQPEAEACAALTVEVVAERIPRRFGLDARRDVQVLTPTHRGPAGVANMNTLLQAALNPPAPGRDEHRFGATTFRVGDRVLQLRNNYDLDVYNGDIGEITAIDGEEQLVTVCYDGERNVHYDFSLLDELTLAYAISIHKSQGAEYPCVVIPLLTQHYMLLQRNLVYTGVTRAKQLVVLLGDPRAVAMSVKNNRVEQRYTGLARRLAGGGD